MHSPLKRETSQAAFDPQPESLAEPVSGVPPWEYLELQRLERLQVASWAEAATLVLLVGFAVPLKHFGGLGAGVSVLGPIHGAAFLTYLWLAIDAVSAGDWRAAEIARLFVAAFVPFGPLLSSGLLRRKRAAVGQVPGARPSAAP